MIRRTLSVTLLLSGLAAPVSATGPTTLYFGTQCYVGLFRACVNASMEIHYRSYLAETHSEVRVTLSNLSGLSGFETSQYLGLTHWSLTDLTSVRPMVQHEDFGHWEEGEITGNAGGYNSVGAGWQDGALWMQPDYGEFHPPLFGCVQPDAYFGSAGPLFTCGGSITFLAYVPTVVEFKPTTRLALTWGDYQVQDGHLTRPTAVGCTSGDTCHSVPEPWAAALILPGLALLGVDWKRRRP